MAFIDKYMKNKELDLKTQIKYFSVTTTDGKSIINAYVTIGGSMYRVRSELIVFNKDHTQIYAIKLNDFNQYGIKATLPGGSAEPGRSLKNQAIIETMEECGINVKNVFYTDVKIVKRYTKYPKWQKELLWPLGYRYEGHCTFIFVGEYDKKMDGSIKDIEIDFESAKRFNFYFPEELSLDKERIEVIKRYSN